MGKLSRPRPKRIGFLLYDDVTALDVVGPMEAFASARRLTTTTPCYELLTVGITRKEVSAESGLLLRPEVTFAQCPRLDTLLIPGGRGLRTPHINRSVAKWIRSRANTTRRIASVCTGIYGVAPPGLLDGHTPSPVN